MLEKSIKVFDNVLSQDQIDAWKNYYLNTSFRRSPNESGPDGPVYFGRDMFYQDLIEIFDYENTIVHYAKQLDNRITSKVYRSYINIFNEGDKFTGHKDLDEIPADKYAVSCVLFLNPEWEDSGGGLAFKGDNQHIVVQNQFNRLIVFHGDVHHCVQPYKGNKARITLYTQFNNVIPADLPKVAAQNKW